MRLIKKYWLLILVVALLVELAFFIPWALKINFFQELIEIPASFVQHKDPRVENFKEHIGGVNNALQEQMPHIPLSLAQELESSRIYFMLSTKETRLLQSFTFEDGAFSSPNIEKEEEGDLYYQYSANGNKAAFFAASSERWDMPGGWGAQAQLFVADTTGHNSAFLALDDAVLLDSTNIPFKQHVDVSNSGEVVFTGWDNDWTPSVEHASDWSIYTIADGQAKFVTNGFMPKWLNDTLFVFLKDDGLYVADINLNQEYKIATNEEAVLYSNNRFDISDDGTLLAWIQPNITTISLYDIGSDSTLRLRDTIEDIKGYWSILSPSGNFLAVQTIAADLTGYEQNPQSVIRFIDTATTEIVPELQIDFNAFDQRYMFMTDWVVK